MKSRELLKNSPPISQLELAPTRNPIPSDHAMPRKYSFEYVRERMDELLKIHEYERQRLGQELHDSTGQLVVFLLLSLDRLRSFGAGEERDGIVDEIEEVVRQIDKEIRSLAFLHQQVEPTDLNLLRSLEKLALGFSRRTGINVAFTCVGGSPQINQAMSFALLRIAQEALVNIYRHAYAKSARIKLKIWPDRLQLQVCDDGVGIADAVKEGGSVGIGLKGMRHRVANQGGRMKIRNLRPGLMICVTMPLTG